MVGADALAEEGGAASGEGLVVMVTPASGVGGPDTGPRTAEDQVGSTKPSSMFLL